MERRQERGGMERGNRKAPQKRIFDIHHFQGLVPAALLPLPVIPTPTNQKPAELIWATESQSHHTPGQERTGLLSAPSSSQALTGKLPAISAIFPYQTAAGTAAATPAGGLHQAQEKPCPVGTFLCLNGSRPPKGLRAQAIKSPPYWGNAEESAGRSAPESLALRQGTRSTILSFPGGPLWGSQTHHSHTMLRQRHFLSLAVKPSISTHYPVPSHCWETSSPHFSEKILHPTQA